MSKIDPCEALSATTDLEDLEPGEYKPINEGTILTQEQMSIYYMGYVEGMKWLIKFLQEPKREPITDNDMEIFFADTLKRIKKNE